MPHKPEPAERIVTRSQSKANRVAQTQTDSEFCVCLDPPHRPIMDEAQK